MIGEQRGVLVEKAVARVRIDPQLGVGQVVSEQIAVQVASPSPIDATDPTIGLYGATNTSRLSGLDMAAPFSAGSARLFVPPPNGDDDEHLGSLWEVVDVRHAVGGVTGKRLQLILMGRDDHDMWTDVEILVWRLGWRILVRYPGAHVHIGDANPVDVSRPACQAILDPLHEDSIKAPRLVMRIARDAGEASPFARALPENAVLTIRTANRESSRPS